MCQNCYQNNSAAGRAHALLASVIGEGNADRLASGRGIRLTASDGTPFIMRGGAVVELAKTTGQPKTYWCGNLGYYPNFPQDDHYLGQYLTITTDVEHWRSKAVPTSIHNFDRHFYEGYVLDADDE